MKQKTIAKVKNALRRLTYSDPYRISAKARCKVDVALHRCENCFLLCYDGKSEKNLEKLAFKYGEVCDRSVEMDHIHPVIDPTDGFTTWDTYINSLLPEDSRAYQGLCYFCHQLKTYEEDIDRGKVKENWDHKIELIYGIS